MSTRRTFLLQAAAATVTAAQAGESVVDPASAGAKMKRSHDVEAELSNPKQNAEIVRLAIVGTGQISHRYLKEAAANDRMRFVATCARTMESAKARAAEYGIEAWFDDYEAMYEKVRPDAVVIATPSSVHAAPAIAALSRKIHVLCEKPMATNFGDCEAMVAAARVHKVLLLAMPFNASPSFLAALDFLNEASIGVFTGAEAQLNIAGHQRANWYYDRNIAGGVMLDTMVYPVARLIEMLGPARRVTGFVNTLIPRRVVGDEIVKSSIDDNVSLLIEWASGQQAILRALWGTSLFRGDAFVYGRKGTLIMKVFGGDVIVHSPARPIKGAEPVVWSGQKDCYRVSNKLASETTGSGVLNHLVDCIQGRAQPTCGGPQQLHVHEILFKGYQASITGRVQELETTFQPWHVIDPEFFDTRSRPI